jgi:hypothetical protein
MKIGKFVVDRMGDRKRVSAAVTWEDCDRPPCEIYFETDYRFAESLWCNPHAFVVGCVIPAFVLGEARVLVEEAICPELREGLTTALMWLRHWFYPSDRKLPRIEAKVEASARQRATAARAGLLFSGGVDSLSVLRWNRLHVPLEHPASIKDGVLIFGLQGEDAQMRREIEAQLSVVAEEAGIVLVPIATNLVQSLGDVVPWEERWEASVLASVAHTLAGRLTQVSIASTHDIRNMFPLGTHPVLDPNFGSSDLRIRHEGIMLSRLAKTKLIAEWETALQNLRVCNVVPFAKKTSQGTLNCGKCEKCLRTKLAMLVLGVLHRTRVFPEKEVSAEMLRALRFRDIGHVADFYGELIPFLQDQGRTELISAVRGLLKKGRRARVVEKLKSRMKDLDRHYLGAALTTLRRKLQPEIVVPSQGM